MNTIPHPSSLATGGRAGVALIGPARHMLSQAEASRLIDLEKIIEAGRETFVHVGLALQEIKDNRLWRFKWQSFEDYCLQRFDFGRRRANQMIAAAEIHSDLSRQISSSGSGSASDSLPTTESQIRPLAALAPERRLEAWKKVAKIAADRPITAKDVREVVDSQLDFRLQSEPSDPSETSATSDSGQKAFLDSTRGTTSAIRHLRRLLLDLSAPATVEIRQQMQSLFDSAKSLHREWMTKTSTWDQAAAARPSASASASSRTAAVSPRPAAARSSDSALRAPRSALARPPVLSAIRKSTDRQYLNQIRTNSDLSVRFRNAADRRLRKLKPKSK
jgi:hypothetical protein